ncbi:DER1-domain-containing protein [Pseudovirgaria hyperparasitica]|uniref:Derlin n=1 Tax=Pseudovirgaria hyperparasitica TaxID=470096 RepID=A0A6A6W1E0_9PEZI|nr:DER1-domain-containing protein [Pseudovirgaria hyperparasitica]KAF2755949.1 DER1-domain-containing protein [Pseudovirgaria hyperparasitica]
MDVFWQAPPVSRTLAASALIVSLLGHGKLIPLYPFAFISRQVFKLPPEIWRPMTAFLVTGPKLGIILDPFFLYRYGSSLETGSPRFSRPGDFFTYTLFVMTSIVVACGLGLGGFFFMSALTLAFAYTYSQDNPNVQIQFFIINFPAKYLPLAMLLMSFIMEGPTVCLEQSTGIFAAHLYDFFTRIWPAFGGGSREPWIKTPRLIAQAFGADHVGPRPRAYGTAFAPPGDVDEPNAGRTTGASWNRGPGRRLG